MLFFTSRRGSKKSTVVTEVQTCGLPFKERGGERGGGGGERGGGGGGGEVPDKEGTWDSAVAHGGQEGVKTAGAGKEDGWQVGRR